MKISAVSKYAKISPSKAISFARLLKGLSVADALKVAKFSNKKAAWLVEKTLKSAIADAENNANLSADDFHVENVIIERGPSTSRYWARSRGMARSIERRTSHIRVVLTDGN